MLCLFFFQAEDGIRDIGVTGVQTCALPISVGEVPVDDGLAGSGGGGDLLHADAGAVPAHRGDGGVDQLLAAGAAVLVPPRVAAGAAPPPPPPHNHRTP